jgi:hypothetical protein
MSTMYASSKFKDPVECRGLLYYTVDIGSYVVSGECRGLLYYSYSKVGSLQLPEVPGSSRM